MNYISKQRFYFLQIKKDFDIAGAFDPMVPDSECLKIITEILDKLEFKNHVIKINHRKLLDAIYEICEVPIQSYSHVSSCIDKLDKIGWNGIKQLMLENGIKDNIFDKIYGFINHKGIFRDTVSFLMSNECLMKNKKANEAIAELQLLVKYCEILKISDRVRIFLSNKKKKIFELFSCRLNLT